jgi:molybdopterin converting factor small subunit
LRKCQEVKALAFLPGRALNPVIHYPGGGFFLKVLVKPYLFLRQILGFKETVLDLPEGTDISHLLQLLRRDYNLPEKVNIAGGQLTLMNGEDPVGLIIMVNGRNLSQLQGMDTVLDEAAVISLFPPAAGG